MEDTEKKHEEQKVEPEEKGDLVMSVFLKEVKMETQLGIAIVNTTERKFLVSEFADNAFLTNLENMIMQMAENDSDSNMNFKLIVPIGAFPHLGDKIKDLCKNCEVRLTDVTPEDYVTTSVPLMLKQLLNPKAKFLLNEAEMDVALAALAGAIQHMKLLRDKTNTQQFTLETYRHTLFMRLDVAATRALNVFPSKFGGGFAPATTAATSAVTSIHEKLFGVDSIYTLLNQCKTKIGSRLLKKWLMHPLQNVNEIETRLKLVEFLKEHRILRQTLQKDYLRLLPDIEVLCSRFYKIKAKKRNSSSLMDCVRAYHMVQALKKLGRYMSEDPECTGNSIINERYTTKIVAWCNDYNKLEELVEISIDFEKVSQHEYVIHPRFSQELQQLRDRITEIKNKLEELRQGVMNDLHVTKQVRLVESTNFTFLFEMEKKEAADKMRVSKKSYKVVNTKKCAMSFTCPELQSLCKEYDTTLKLYRNQQTEVTGKVLEIVASYYPIMEATSATVAELDVLISFAQIADTAPRAYVKPVIREGGNLRLKESRHPLIEWNKPSECISNDCYFDKDSDTFHVITGLNMGGKSTYIRQVGICAYLAHVGSFVPCAEAEVPLMDCIIARVGAADHQLRGISTFLAEMLEVTCMLKSATSKSLLLVDEIGRGTSTNDGFGLAWAIADYVATKLKSLCLFATHFGEITAMSKKLANVKNYYADASIKEGEITMLYKIKEGTVGKSYGIHVIEMLQFPADVVEKAKETLRELEEVSVNNQ